MENKIENKIENIKNLLELSGYSNTSKELLYSIVNSIKHLIPNYNESKIENVISKVLIEFNNEVVQLYDKNFTNDDIIGIINFYQSDIGKIYLNKMGTISLEIMRIGNKYGEIIFNELNDKNN